MSSKWTQQGGALLLDGKPQTTKQVLEALERLQARLDALTKLIESG